MAGAVAGGPVPDLPRYGHRSLAEVVRSLLAARGVEGFDDALGIEPTRGLCLFVVDGLGWEHILRFGDAAPFLHAAASADGAMPVTSGFPSTTAASLASLGTGLPPGRHGLVGYAVAVPGHDRPMNVLRWELYGIGPDADLVTAFPPEVFQPEPTILERSAAAGTEVTIVGPPEHATTPLTRAILRGGRYDGAATLQDVVLVADLALREGRTVYAYHPSLDTTAHIFGVGSPQHLEYLAKVDAAVAALADRMPPGAALAVTGDHGMVNLAHEQKLDLADERELAAGVRLLAGEARARHVHAVPGAEADVLAIWREVVGDRMWVRTREEAIEAGWFGPVVADRVRSRIGDVVAAAHAPVGVFQRQLDPLQWSLVGHHGSLTDDERLVPLLLFRG